MSDSVSADHITCDSCGGRLMCVVYDGTDGIEPGPEHLVHEDETRADYCAHDIPNWSEVKPCIPHWATVITHTLPGDLDYPEEPA